MTDQTELAERRLVWAMELQREVTLRDELARVEGQMDNIDQVVRGILEAREKFALDYDVLLSESKRLREQLEALAAPRYFLMETAPADLLRRRAEIGILADAYVQNIRETKWESLPCEEGNRRLSVLQARLAELTNEDLMLQAECLDV